MVDRMFESLGELNTEIMLAVAESPHGRALDNQIRWAQYCHIVEDVKPQFLPLERREEVVREWEGLLDVDVNNLHHNNFTALLALAFCRMEGVSDEVTDLVVCMGLVHDLSEAIFNPDTDEGDVMHDEAVARGQAAFEAEHLQLDDILGSDYFPMVSPELRQKIIEGLNDSRLAEPQTEPGKIFEIIEKMGYVHTSLNANKARHESKEVLSSEQIARFKWMADNGLANHIPRLVGLSERYTSLEWFLDQRADDIAEAIFDLNGKAQQREIGDFYQQKGQDVAERHRKWDRAVEAFMQFELKHVGVQA